jgi:hypothetical protein
MGWIPTTGFDYETAGRHLSPSERAILKRLEADDRIREGARLDSLFQDCSQDVHLESGGEERREGSPHASPQRTWFGVSLGRD